MYDRVQQTSKRRQQTCMPIRRRQSQDFLTSKTNGILPSPSSISHYLTSIPKAVDSRAFPPHPEIPAAPTPVSSPTSPRRGERPPFLISVCFPTATGPPVCLEARIPEVAPLRASGLRKATWDLEALYRSHGDLPSTSQRPFCAALLGAGERARRGRQLLLRLVRQRRCRLLRRRSNCASQIGRRNYLIQKSKWTDPATS
jgi:hypothetical protein